MPGPDFPTGALICGTAGIRQAYETGRGLLTVRGRAEFEESKRGTRIVITEIPFLLNKASLQEKIAEQVREERGASTASATSATSRTARACAS
jgi:DNA gyrase subunit A